MDKKLNKVAITDSLFDTLDRKVPRGEAAELVDAVFEEMKRGIAREGKLMISGFGAFDVREKAARAGRNPQTGEPLPIAARRVVRFKVSAALKAEMNAANGEQRKHEVRAAGGLPFPAHQAATPVLARISCGDSVAMGADDWCDDIGRHGTRMAMLFQQFSGVMR